MWHYCLDCIYMISGVCTYHACILWGSRFGYGEFSVRSKHNLKESYQFPIFYQHSET